MHRSASTSRAYDEYLKYYSSQELPVFEPMSEESSKKGRSRTRFSDNAIHLIPFLLLFCALILWFLSNPDMDLAMMKVDDEASVRLVGELDSDTDQTGALAGIDLGLENLHSTKQDDNNNSDKEASSFPMNNKS
ncbi:uncharacterized protein LOC124932596 [Impatiens glandulifera]|uniref:uncharacterized protein LOC124932596 n=1 Tax=Impatiens glandulifera TaxID=253017 RepID=UPI001FB078A3|nr:uncharacterized protein LOC124932596 [Impatiens glandulifera]